MRLTPQMLAEATAKEAVMVLREQPNTPMMYAAYGLLEAFIRLAEQTGQDLSPEMYGYCQSLSDIIDAD